jgi:transcriptional regulator with AAA-type ATPase domain
VPRLRQAIHSVVMAGLGDELIGSSAGWREVQKTIGLLADNDATVLILGETGTGKEVVARAVHRYGRRSDARFVAVNCAALPGELLESLLFDYVRGAFTGAVTDRPGSFREANGGTLFLDEIADIELATQAKLLHALQERAVTPIGGKTVAVDVRVIAATHRDLAGFVRAGPARICSTALASCHCVCRRCASALLTLSHWRSTFWRPRRWAMRQSTSRPTPQHACSRTTGRAMCASCVMQWNASTLSFDGPLSPRLIWGSFPTAAHRSR